MKNLIPRFGFFTCLLLASALLVAAQTVDEEMRVDDGTADGVPVGGTDLHAFNRFTPLRYPATLKSIKLFLRRVNNTPVGTPFRLVVFGNSLSVASVSFPRPASFAYTQNVTVPEVSVAGEFVEFTLTNPIQITSGDVYAGFQQLSTAGPFAWLDGSEPYPLRSYVILPGDTSVRNDFFVTNGFPPEQPAVNFMIRAVVSLPAAAPPIAAVSAASYFAGDVAPESIVSVFGTNMASGIGFGATFPLPTTLNGTTAKITDSANVTRDAGLFFVSLGQINLEIPANTAEGAATLTVTNSGGQSFSTRINVRAVVPGLFTLNGNGLGVAAAQLLRVRADGSQVYEEVARFEGGQWLPKPIVFGPESEQAVLILYGTGFRKRSDPNAARVNIQQSNGVQLPMLYAGPQGSFVGLDQINALLPRTLAGKGEMHLRAVVDGRAANLVKLNFQ